MQCFFFEKLQQININCFSQITVIDYFIFLVQNQVADSYLYYNS